MKAFVIIKVLTEDDQKLVKSMLEPKIISILEISNAKIKGDNNMPDTNAVATTGNTTGNPLANILDEIDKAITTPDTGILANITKLMDAPEDKQKAAIVTLIGSVIGLVIKCIKVAIPQN